MELCYCRVAEAIESLYKDYLGWPQDPAKRFASMRRFYDVAQFPSVCGAVDGTHINVIPSKTAEPCFVNRHRQHSLNVCAVAGGNYAFYYVNARHPGRSHDSRVLQETGLWAKFERGFRPFKGAVILGDSAYPLRDWLMTPFRTTVVMTPAMQSYQRSHSRTRGIVEKAFGVLKMRFRALHTGLRVADIDQAAHIIMAACVIHNICIEQGDDLSEYLEEYELLPGSEQSEMDIVNPREEVELQPAAGETRRSKFVSHFDRV